MNVVHESATQWGQWFFHAGWQAALVAGIAFIIVLLSRRRASSQLRYALLLVVLAKFATPPFLSFPTGMIARTVPPVSDPFVVQVPIMMAEPVADSDVADTSGADTAEVPPPAGDSGSSPREPVSWSAIVAGSKPPDSGFPWSVVLMIVHGIGSAVLAVLLIRRYRALRDIVRSAQIQTGGPVAADVQRIADRLWLRSSPEVRLSDGTDAPFAIGVFRPVVVLPRVMVEQLPVDQLGIVVAHELAHVRRRDLLIGWIETLVSVVWWFHPAMWWLQKSLRQTREDCCDDVLLTTDLAEPERYCETLIDAAARQSMVLSEPIALGFAHREHAAARRIRRLMDGSLFRSDRLRVPSIALAVLFGLVMLPGMVPERGPVHETTLGGLFGWRNLPFRIGQGEEADVNECRTIAQTFMSTRNDQRAFDQPATRDRLEAILDRRPDFFYAQHLLGTWHRRNGNPETAARLLNASLVNAPVVLTQPYKLGDGSPVRTIEVTHIEIECNRVQNGSLNPDLNLKFVGLVTDANGEILLPVYDTVFRLKSYTYPTGFGGEKVSLGWFESQARTGVLPAVTVWRPWSRPSSFSRTSNESPRLIDGRGTDSLTLQSGANTYVIAQVGRGNQDGTVTVEDGKRNSRSSANPSFPSLTNAAYMDHAFIDLSQPDPRRFEVAGLEVLDSQTKIPLQEFQSGAGFRFHHKRRIRLFSLWNPLPESVDIVLKVHNYDAAGFRLQLAPEVDAAAQHDGNSVAVVRLLDGEYSGWSAQGGFQGDPKNVGDTCTAMFRFAGNSDVKYSIWTVLKNGRRIDLKPGGWHSARVFGTPTRIMTPLDSIDHFELLPYVEPETIYFEHIRLPPRRGPLQKEIPDVEFRVKGTARAHTSILFNPMQVDMDSHRGDVYGGFASNNQWFHFVRKQVDPESFQSETTIRWRTDVPADFDHQLEFVIDGDTEQRQGGGSFQTSGEWGAAGAQHRNVPLETVRAVRLKLLPKKGAE